MEAQATLELCDLLSEAIAVRKRRIQLLEELAATDAELKAIIDKMEKLRAQPS